MVKNVISAEFALNADRLWKTCLTQKGRDL